MLFGLFFLYRTDNVIQVFRLNTSIHFCSTLIMSAASSVLISCLFFFSFAINLNTRAVTLDSFVREENLEIFLSLGIGFDCTFLCFLWNSHTDKFCFVHNP